MLTLFGGANLGKSANVSAQRRINLYLEVIPQGDKSSTVLYGRPGLVRINPTTGGHPSSGGPIRGMQEVNQSYDTVTVTVGGQQQTTQQFREHLFAVAGNGLLYFNAIDEYLVAPGDLITGTGPVRMATDGNSVMAVNGETGYFLPISFAQVNDIAKLTTTFPAGARTICSVGDRYFVDDPSVPGQFRWSALLNGQSWPAENFANAESVPDALTGVFESNGELLLFGTQSVEFWALAGGTQVVQRVGGSTAQWGTDAYDTIRKVGASVCFLGRNRGGDRQVVMLEGYQPRVVSDPDVERDIARDPSPDAATGLSYSVAGHQFYQLNLTDTSWVYDATSGVWQEFQTDGLRHAAEWGASAFGKFLVSDYRDGRIYYMSQDVQTDDGEPIVREFTSKHVFDNLDRMTCWELVLDMETGAGQSSGVEPQVMLQVSKDGGHTFGNEMWTGMGNVGEYLKRAVWRRLGRARDWVFRFRVADPTKVVFMAAAVRLEK